MSVANAKQPTGNLRPLVSLEQSRLFIDSLARVYVVTERSHGPVYIASSPYPMFTSHCEPHLRNLGLWHEAGKPYLISYLERLHTMTAVAERIGLTQFGGG